MPDPAQEKTAARTAQTFGELSIRYLAEHAQVKKRSWKDDRRRIDSKLLPHWRDQTLKHLSRQTVADLIAAVAKRGKVEANRVLALVSKMLNFAVDQGWIDANPAARMAKPGGESSRERVLSDDELVTAWDMIAQAEAGHSKRQVALAAMPPHRSRRASWRVDDPRLLHPLLADYLRLRLLLLQRGTETIQMRWPDLALSEGWWTIPGAYTKNKLPHRVPLTAPALAILKALETSRVAGQTWVFPNERGTGPRLHRAMRIRLAVITSIADVGPRDFRRTGSTTMGRLKVPRLHISMVLNHVDKGPRSTKVYDRYAYDAEKRLALEVWTEELRRILGLRLPAEERNAAA